MNEQFIIEFIRQRMCEQDVCEYHFEPFFYVPLKTGQTFYLSNEVWYLVGLPTQVTISSDTAIYSSTGSFTSILPAEFSGNVRIISAEDTTVPLHFIRLIIQKA